MTIFERIASGDYQTSDGRFIMYRIPDIHPPAWNIEDTSDFSIIVDGAATMRDAIAIFADRETTRRKESH